jgi:hypothetical protein
LGRDEAAWRKQHDKICTDCGRCGLAVGRNFARDGKKSRGASSHGKPFHPGINETTPRPTVADPYYRLSDSYYGYSDPYHGLFDVFAVPPFSPGYSYGHLRMPLR